VSSMVAIVGPPHAGRFVLIALMAAPLVLGSFGAAFSDQLEVVVRPDEPPGFVEKLTTAALNRTGNEIRYDGRYHSIGYPGGDVPAHLGVCTDVLIRSYRMLGIDLQKEVHEDMSAVFHLYPTRWGLAGPDPNIDHRRVPNLEVFFARKGHALPVTDDSRDYQPGDIVSWMVGNLPHIGMIVPVRSEDGLRFLVVHNIGRGPEVEDMVFAYPIVGHFRYYGP